MKQINLIQKTTKTPQALNIKKIESALRILIESELASL
jgi:hypothetical protein